MYAGSDDACRRATCVLAGLTDRHYRGRPARPGPGDEAGQQLPLATSLLATSEAIAFGLAEGLGWEPCSTCSTPSGRSAATSDKFPDHVVTRRYASGFANSLMAKDVQLYLRAVEERGTPRRRRRDHGVGVGRVGIAEPGADFTRIHPFVAGT